MSAFWKKGAAVAASVGTLALVLAGCGASTSNNTTGGSNASTGTGTNTAAGKPVEGGKITLDMLQNIRDLDPALDYDSASTEIVSQMYDQLVTWKDGGTKIVPMAAQSYDVSKDGLTYTFHLRKNMKFWNGDPVTAQSFIDEFYRVLSPKMGSGGQSFYEIIQGADKYAAGKSNTIPGLSAPDKYTLVIKLSKPEAFFLQTLTLPFASAVDKKFIESVGNHKVYEKNPTFDSTQAMGSGPFELQTINSNQIILKKNPNYWRTDSYGQKLPYLDQVTFNINNNDQVDALHFQQGQTAFIGWNFGGQGIPSSAYPQFMSNPNLKKLTTTMVQNSVEYIGLNTTYGPTKNKLVRQAIEYAIDKKAILKLANGRGQIANQPLPPGVVGYDDNVSPQAQYSYNPAKAKQLLKQAGYPHGLTIDYYTENSNDRMKYSQAIQEQLAKVGIKLKIHSSSWGTFLNVAEAGKAPIALLGWVQDFPDASDFLNVLFNSSQAPTNNTTNYKNAQVDQWLNTAQYSNDQNQRNQLYAKVTDKVMEDAAWVPLWYDTFTAAVQPWVHGFYIPQSGTDPLVTIWVDKSHQG
ncbi:ABC transporter substrate-binding protein [Alicyclobacillus herbarius]|uniref:ABC transporter substrate-binding protein n=1 Tax=Alicyclobacillus herbarius TaxID=122960 RepID=UPI000429ED93|nr:ABC transporter substrate-binding protein [Alicyclobacillus herbarius]